MIQNILRFLDFLAIILSGIASYALWTSGSNIVSMLLIVLSPILLLLAKYQGNRLLLFAAYVTTTVYFTAIIYNGLSNSPIDFFQADFRILLFGLIAVALSLIAAVIGFGTNTLTILWLSLQGIVLYETFSQFPANRFLEHFWSAPIIDAVVRDDYPILLMVIWIGLFLDKYQKELQREYWFR
ncbi:hypothetical protein D1953_00075 [Peribacillus asahii]|uniref:Integral membrane protein n=1 Tax=Peribacillus asahii TaxID=228899 RepID=A0A398BKP8_9BACI|nr:hypothetical protein [Peribacillus asahii]RID89551.1 hypothetical protein D1953_00075 [Peribacillus asahii]